MYHYTARHELNSFELLSSVTKFGYLGVPIFFIISGYVISLSASNRSAFEFAISRFTRLYPAFWAGIIFTVIIVTLLNQKDYSIGQILANLTMVNDYLGYKNIDGVYWTLQAELKFYACVFLLVFFKVFDKFKIWVSIWLLLTMLFLISNQPFFLGWFITPFYSSFFIAGVAFYLIEKEGGNNFNIIVLFTSLIISSFYSFQQAKGFMANPGVTSQIIAVVLIWGFYFLFYALITKKITLSNRRYYLTLGGLTYPLYLVHNVAGKAIIDIYLKSLPDWLAVTITIIFVLGISFIIHIFIEKKIATPMKISLLYMLNSAKKMKNT